MIYAAVRRSDGCIKIGTSTNPHERMSTLSLKGRHRNVLIAIWEGGRQEEHEAHQALMKWNVNKPLGNYMPWRGEREWFYPSRSVLRFIRKAAVLVRKDGFEA